MTDPYFKSEDFTGKFPEGQPRYSVVLSPAGAAEIANARVAPLIAEHNELKAKYDFMVDSAQQNARERDAAEAERDRLRAALEVVLSEASEQYPMLDNILDTARAALRGEK